MADEEENKPEEGEEETEFEVDEEGNPVLDEDGNPIPKKKKSKKKLIIIILILLILGGGGAAAFFMGLIPGMGGEAEEEVSEEIVEKPEYLELEEFLVNLNNPDRQVSFLKMKVTLELPNVNTMTSVQERLPRIRDSFQVYLRELRNSDLQGSNGVQRLKEELLLRINKILEPESVNEILIKDMVVQ